MALRLMARSERQCSRRTLHQTTVDSLMKVSARNALPGILRKIDEGVVNAEVTIELAPKLVVVSIVTLDAVKNLGLKVGARAYAVIKASSVMVGVD